MIEPVLLPGAADHRGALLWRFDPPVSSVSSAPVGGGFTTANWVVNTAVTASDAVVIVWPGAGDPVPFAGPRSPWGARLAQSTLQTVAAGIEAAR